MICARPATPFEAIEVHGLDARVLQAEHTALPCGAEEQMLNLTQYVRIVATGAIGRIEQWTQATNQYLVEINRDSSTRQWFAESELEPTEAPNDSQ